MSEFFRALGQAERDRALREQGKSGRQPQPPVEEPPVVEEPAVDVVVDDVAVDVEKASTPFATRVARATSALLRKPSLVIARQETLAPPPVDPEFQGLDSHFVSLVTPATFEAEQYRALRHMIEEQHAASGMSVVAVSSPAVGDGKTTTAINLAGALAQCPGARVLLIEADLRRPSIAGHLALQSQPSPGLVGMLVDRTVTLASAVRQRPPFKLDILPAGDTPPAPYELLRSGNLAELMKQARSHYNYVVVDGPPLVGTPDCRVLASFVDGFVIVVAAHRTPKRLVEEAVAVVEPTKMIGLVFNMDERPFAGHYRRHAAATTNGNGNGHRKWPWDWQRAWKS
jgi:capsular exopolysaccharide synthesis family protein